MPKHILLLLSTNTISFPLPPIELELSVWYICFILVLMMLLGSPYTGSNPYDITPTEFTFNDLVFVSYLTLYSTDKEFSLGMEIGKYNSSALTAILMIEATTIIKHLNTFILLFDFKHSRFVPTYYETLIMLICGIMKPSKHFDADSLYNACNKRIAHQERTPHVG